VEKCRSRKEGQDFVSILSRTAIGQRRSPERTSDDPLKIQESHHKLRKHHI
jgi:hypothetical protein